MIILKVLFFNVFQRKTNIKVPYATHTEIASAISTLNHNRQNKFLILNYHKDIYIEIANAISFTKIQIVEYNNSIKIK